MAWIFNHRRVPGAVEFYIGRVWIARVHFISGRRQTLLELPGTPDIEEYENFAASLAQLHVELNGEPPADHGVGKIWKDRPGASQERP